MHSSDPAGHPQASQALPGQGESSHLTRRERAAIATQACETCRTRKSKCDEQRPKCGLCRRLNVECTYREPQPTKKDKTMVYILDTITRLENKVDIIGRHVSPNSTTFGPLSHSSSSSTSNLTSPPVRDSGAKHSPFDGLQASDSSYTYKHITTPHKVLLWPAIYMQQLAVRGNSAEEINQLMLEGTPWLLRHELRQDDDILPCDVMMRGLAVPETSPEATAGRRVTFPDLPVDLMSEYSHRYFDSFNMLWPILDREFFNIDILRTITMDGFAEGDSRSILALLVFALGKLALEGVSGAPIDGQQSGIRGGTAKRPPGLEIFNEARRRLGFIMTQVSVENIQCLLLTALYYEASARHVDFWRLMVSASMACQVLLKCEPIDWQSPRGEQMKRVYWTCNLIENWYHIDLDLPRTGIFDFEDAVPLPGGNVVGAASENHRIFTHFAAIVSLCQLITRIHKVIFEANSPNAEAPSPDDNSGPSIAVISELARQLQSWRELLPAALQWDDNDRFSLGHQSAMQAQTSERRTSVPLFSSSTRQPLHYQPDYNVLTAHLRSRYYYAHFMIFRPFVFKALHFPESMTPEDKQLAARCLRSSLLWPIAMSPCREQKRVLPVLFAWTSNFLGILLILRMITITPMLDQIARESLDPAEVQDTVVLLLGWMKDMSQVEGIAKWSWELLRQLFSEVEGIAG